MQHMRHSIHKQAEAAIEEAQAQQELNASQYDHAGRSLVHIKVCKFALHAQVAASQDMSELGHLAKCRVCLTWTLDEQYAARRNAGMQRYLHCL